MARVPMDLGFTASAFRPRRPSQPAHAIERPALQARLDRLIAASRVVTVVAPAGFGKSCALSSWVESSLHPSAWVSLTARDRNPEHLARAVNAALEELQTEAGEADRSATVGDGTPESDLRVLVIDDIQLATSAGLNAMLVQLLDRAPRSLRVVLAGRQEPGHGLTRLLADGELARLSLGDLAFSAAEVGLAATAMGRPLTRGRVGELHKLTNGWPVAVRLALMSWPSFETELSATLQIATESQIPQLADYLLENVIAQLPASLRSFVPRACTCDWLTGRLANELAGSGNGTELLERALALGLPLERRGLWQGEPVYRWHPVMAQAGRAILVRRDPELALDLHLRAARFLSVIEPNEAANQALRGHDPELAATLIRAQWLEPVLRGDSDSIEELCGRLPARWAEDPRILLIRAVCRRDAGDLPAAAELKRRAAQAATTLDPDERHGHELTELLAGLLLTDDSEDLAVLSARGQQLLAADLRLDGRLRAGATLLIGWVELRLRRINRAVRILREAMQLCQAEGLESLAERARANYTYALAYSGDFVSARAQLAQANSNDQLAGWRVADGSIESYTRGHIRFWSGDLDGAHTAFQQAVEKVGGPTSFNRLARVGLIHAALGRGDKREIANAEALLDDLPTGTAQGMPWAVWRTVSKAGIMLFRGDPEAAASLLDSLGPDAAEAPGMIPLIAETYWRCERPAKARAYAAILTEDYPAYLRIGGLVVTSLCEWLDGSTEVAHSLLDEALELGSTFGLTRPFQLQDPRLDGLLSEHAARETRHAAFLASQLVHRRARLHELGPDLLSEREREILGYLATPLTAAEICAELFISQNTLKTHVRSIYRKLGVDNRRDAVRSV